MPRVKSSKTETVRLELGVKEREVLDLLVGTEVASRLLKPVGFLLGGAGAALAGYALYQWLSDSPFDDILSELFPKVNLPDEGMPDAAGGQGGAFGGPRPGNPLFWTKDDDGNWVRIED